VDQIHRDVLHLLRFSLEHPPKAAPVMFPMFAREEIDRLYEIPREVREKVWKNRHRPEYRSLLESRIG